MKLIKPAAVLWPMLLSASVFADDFYVSTNGSDANAGSKGSPWLTLARACATVSADQNHTIHLGEGTFAEAAIVTVPSGVNILGAGIGKTIVTGKDGAFYTLQLPVWDSHHEKFLLQFPNGKNQTISNFSLDGAGRKVHGAIYAPKASDVRFLKLDVKHFNWGGLYVAWSTNVEIGNGIFADNGYPNTSSTSAGSSIFYFGDTRLSIHDLTINQISPEARDGVYGIKDWHPNARENHFYDQPGDVVTELKIWNCTIKVSSMGSWNNWGSPAIAIENVWCPVVNCEIRNCWLNNSVSLVQGRHGSTGQGWHLHHNIWDMWDIAYAVELNTSYIEIDHNYIRGGVYPFAQWDGGNRNKHIDIHHNTILTDGKKDNIFSQGLYRSIGGADSLHIYNNTIVVTRFPHAMLYIEHDKSWGDLQIKNNIFLNQTSTTVPLLKNKYTGEIDNNVFVNVTATGTHAFTNDPGLKLVGDRPFPFFEASSDASFIVDKGVDVGFKFYGSAPDIGAAERGVAAWQVGAIPGGKEVQ